jgi:hypothetical protein
VVWPVVDYDIADRGVEMTVADDEAPAAAAAAAAALGAAGKRVVAAAAAVATWFYSANLSVLNASE